MVVASRTAAADSELWIRDAEVSALCDRMVCPRRSIMLTRHTSLEGESRSRYLGQCSLDREARHAVARRHDAAALSSQAGFWSRAFDLDILPTFAVSCRRGESFAVLITTAPTLDTKRASKISGRMRLWFLAVWLIGCTSSTFAGANRDGCNDSSRSGDISLFCRFQAAYKCVGISAFDLGGLNWRLQRWGYGCYSSERNMGLDVRAADDIDACGRAHDLDWHAICQNHPELDRDRDNPDSPGCDCYHHTPALECNRSVDPAKLELTKIDGDSAECERLCGEELIKQATCFAKEIKALGYDQWPRRQYHTPWTWSSGPACIPDYCMDRSLTDARQFQSEFGTVEPPPNFDRPDIETCEPPGGRGEPPGRP